MSNFLKECLSSGSKISSKRVVTLSSLVVLAIGFFSNLFFGFKIDPSAFESIQMVTLLGLGATASEKFAKQKGTEDSEPTN